jgi:hypothetical protein
VVIAYSLLYPGVNAAQHLTVWKVPTFGVPCPTTIFTAGLLMLGPAPSWRLAIVPVIWSAIGGSAAFLLGVSADYGLPIAGLHWLCFRSGGRSEGSGTLYPALVPLELPSPETSRSITCATIDGEAQPSPCPTGQRRRLRS